MFEDDLLSNPDGESGAGSRGGFRQALVNLTPPTHCAICGRELTNVRSQEVGIGPECAEKYFGGQGEPPLVDAAAAEEVLRTAPDPMRTRLNELARDGAWRVDGEVRRKMVQSALWYASYAASFGADPNDIVNAKADPSLLTIAAVERLARAFGYDATADRMVKAWASDLRREEKRRREEREREERERIRLRRGEGRHRGLLGVSAPYSVPYNDACRNARNLFPAYEKIGREFWRYFKPENLAEVCNILSACFGSRLVESPEGDLVALQAMPLQVAPPPSPPAPPPSRATNEPPPTTPAALQPLQIGDSISLPNGGTSIIQYLNPYRRSVGVGAEKGRGYTFFSFEQIEQVNGRPVFDKLNAARAEDAKQEGEPPPTPAAPTSLQRQLPAGLMQHQIEGVEFIDKMKRVLIADEMGLGKTVTASVAIDLRAIVVVPSIVKLNWVREINKWRPELSVHVITGIKPIEDEAAKNADVFVVNYDILANHLPFLLSIGAKTLVGDEIHYTKNLRLQWNKVERRFEPHRSTPKRAAAFYALQLAIPRLIELTGTPIMNRTKELFPLLHMIDPNEWASFVKFCMRYCAGHEEVIPQRGGGERKILVCDGVSNAGELHERISGRQMLRRTKSMLNLPAKSRRTQLVPLDEKSAKSYQRAAEAFLKWVEESGGSSAVAKKAEALVKMTTLRKLAAVGKIQAASDWIGEFCESTGRPLVVASWHNEVHHGLAAAIDEMNRLVGTDDQVVSRVLRYEFVTGERTMAQRQETIDRFQRGEVDVCLYGIPLGVGTTLTRAQDMLFVERAWRPADLVQMEDRIHRIGQQNACVITYLDGAGTIDSAIAALLADKVATSAGVIDGEDLNEEQSISRVMGELFKLGGGPRKRTSRPTKNSGVPEQTAPAYTWYEPLL